MIETQSDTDETQSDTSKDCWSKWLFRVSLVFTLASALLFGLLDSLGIMVAAMVAGGLGMAFCSLDKIALFKAGTFEIRTLQREVQENTATIERIKYLAIGLSKRIRNGTRGANRDFDRTCSGTCEREILKNR